MSKADLRKRLLNDRKATSTYKQELRRSLLESHGFSVNTDRQVVTGHDDEDYYVKGYGSVSDEALIQGMGVQRTPRLTVLKKQRAARKNQIDAGQRVGTLRNSALERISREPAAPLDMRYDDTGDVWQAPSASTRNYYASETADTPTDLDMDRDFGFRLGKGKDYTRHKNQRQGAEPVPFSWRESDYTTENSGVLRAYMDDLKQEHNRLIDAYTVLSATIPGSVDYARNQREARLLLEEIRRISGEKQKLQEAIDRAKTMEWRGPEASQSAADAAKRNYDAAMRTDMYDIHGNLLPDVIAEQQKSRAIYDRAQALSVQDKNEMADTRRAERIAWYERVENTPEYERIINRGKQSDKDIVKYIVDPEKRKFMQQTAEVMGAQESGYEKLMFLTDKQAKTLLYYAGLGDDTAFQNYYNDIEWELNAKYQAYLSSKTAERANKNKIVGIAENIAGSFGSVGGFIETGIQGLKNWLHDDYERVDYNNEGFRGAHMVNDTAEGITKDMGPAAKFFTEVGLSIGQFASKLPFGPTASLAIMSSGAAGQTALDALERGATTEQALMESAVSGVTEYLTEKLPVERLFHLASSRAVKAAVKGGTSSTKNALRNAVKEILKQAGIEGTEELISEYVNTIADIAIMEEKSAAGQYMQQLIADGMTPKDAETEMLKTFFITQPAAAAAGGAISGFFTGGVATATGHRSQLNETGRAVREVYGSDSITDLIQSGLESDSNTKAYQIASKLKGKLDAGKRISDVQTGRLFNANMEAIDAEESRLNPNARNGMMKANTGEDAYNGQRENDPGRIGGTGQTAAETGQNAEGRETSEGVISEVHGNIPLLWRPRFVKNGPSFGEKPYRSWAKPGLVTTQPGTPIYEEQLLAAEYGIPSFVVRDDVWEANGKTVPAFSVHGQIYLKEGIPAEYQGMLVRHEIPHVMKQLDFQPYLDFLDQTPDMLNMDNEDTRSVLDFVADHVGIELGDAASYRDLYDEFNAVIYGSLSKADPLQAAQIKELFKDFDAYVAALEDIQRQFKEARTGGSIREEASVSGRDSGTGGTLERGRILSGGRQAGEITDSLEDVYNGQREDARRTPERVEQPDTVRTDQTVLRGERISGYGVQNTGRETKSNDRIYAGTSSAYAAGTAESAGQKMGGYDTGGTLERGRILSGGRQAGEITDASEDVYNGQREDARRTPAGVGEPDTYRTDQTVLWSGQISESSETHIPRKKESYNRFIERVSGENKSTRQAGGITYAYTPAKNPTQNAQNIADGLRAYGIDSFVYDGEIEANRNGVTTAARGEASTLRDDSVAVRNLAELDADTVVPHEMTHVAQRRGLADHYRDTLIHNINFASPVFQAFVDDISNAYFGGNFDLDTDSQAFYNELMAFISSDIAQNINAEENTEIFYDYAAVQEAWQEMDRAMRAFAPQNSTKAAGKDTAASSVDGESVITEPNPEQDVPFTLEYNDTIQSGRKNKVPEITIQVINRIAEKLGVKVLFEKGGAENGRYENGIIYINTASKTPVADTFFHELTHYLETAGMPYHDFQNAVFESAVFRDFLNGESIADYRNRLIELYRRNGVKLDEAAANNEMVARFVESRLFQNQESINRLARENRTLFQRIRAWLRDLVTRLKGTQFEKDLLKLQRMYEAAATQAKGNPQNTVQYSIAVDTNGNQYVKVDTDQDIFEGIAPKDYNKIAKMYIRDYLMGETPLAENDTTVIDGKSVNKYTNPGDFQEHFSEKMKLSPELRNVLQIGKLVSKSNAKKAGAKYPSYEYYSVDFEIDGRRFHALVNIGVDGDGQKHFYELNQIRPAGRVSSSRPDPTTNSLMRIEHSDGTYPHPADGNSQTRTGQNQQGAAVDTNISRSDTGVNTQDMQEQPKYSFGGEQAKLANRVMLQHAKSMQRAGVSPAEIWEKTGWYEGLEGRWKFEINDREMQFDRYGQMNGENRNPQKLSDFIQHDKLFENYPELKDVNFKIDYLDVFHYGQYDPTTNTITLSRSILDLFPEDVIVHEIQHVIQTEEGFTPGASERSMHYENTAGEIEARDASSRRRWTDTQRRAQLPDQGDGEVYFAQYGIQSARRPGKDLMDIANLTEDDANTTPKLKPRPQVQGDRKSRFGDSVRKTSIFDPQFQTLAEQDTNIQTYDGIANRETMQKANETLNSGGQAYVNELLAKEPTAYTAEDAAAGFILMSRYQATGDYKSMLTVAEKLREAGTAGGQTVQMFSILSRMTPEGMVYYAQKSLSDALKTLSEGKYKQWADKHKDTFKLSDEDVEFIRRRVLQAQKLPAGRDKNILLGEISALIQSKIPSHFGDKTNTLARISMLLNPKTNVRNILGNVIITPQHILSDYVGALADKLISMKTGQRTTGTFRLSALAGMKKGLFESYDDFRRHINTREINNDRFEIGKGGPAFAGKTALGKSLNALDRVTSFLLDAGDRPFYETWFINSLNNQMRLNNVSEPTAAMIDIATQEALQRTWQDDNGFSKVASRLRNTLNFGKKFGLGSLIVPFTKTPANLTKAIVDFSPVGLVKAISADAVRLSKAISRGEATPQIQKQFVSSLSKGVTGTLAMLVFGLLTKAGILSGAGDEDKDVADFEKNILGIRPYSVKIGGKSYSYDWAQPVAGNMAIVADFIQNMEDGKDNYGILKGGGKAFLNNILNALSAGGNILYEQSFMQGVQDFFKEDGLMQGVLGAITDAPSMFTPSILGQVAQYDDDTMRTSYVYNDPIATSINQVKAKIPGLSKTLEPVVDVYGNEVKRNGGDNSIFNVFFNPSNVSSANGNKAAEEVYRLYQETGDKTVFPVKAPYYFTVKGEKYIMTPAERTAYQKLTGEIAREEVSDLASFKPYSMLADEEKIKIITNIYQYGTAKAKEEISDDYEMPKDMQKVSEAEALGVRPYQYLLLKSQYDQDGNDSVTQDEVIDVLNKSGLTRKQKAGLYALQNANWKNNPYK